MKRLLLIFMGVQFLTGCVYHEPRGYSRAIIVTRPSYPQRYYAPPPPRYIPAPPVRRYYEHDEHHHRRPHFQQRRYW